MKNVEANKEELKRIIVNLKETLDPDMCRCFVDAFLTRKLNLKVTNESTHRQIIMIKYSYWLIPLFCLSQESEIHDSHYQDENLIYSVMNLFVAGTNTTGNTIQWALLFMAKYPHFQGAKIYHTLVSGEIQLTVFT